MLINPLDLKGSTLSVIFATHIATMQGQKVTHTWLVANTSYSKNTITTAVNKLKHQGLLTSDAHGQIQLTTGARQMILGQPPDIPETGTVPKIGNVAAAKQQQQQLIGVNPNYEEVAAAASLKAAESVPEIGNEEDEEDDYDYYDTYQHPVDEQDPDDLTGHDAIKLALMQLGYAPPRLHQYMQILEDAFPRTQHALEYIRDMEKDRQNQPERRQTLPLTLHRMMSLDKPRRRRGRRSYLAYLD